MSSWSKADRISCRAYSMHSRPFNSLKDESFPMYAFDTPSSAFWRGFAEKCLDKGLSEEQIEELMRSKLMRHGLDNYDEKIEKLGAEFLTDSMIEWTEKQS